MAKRGGVRPGSGRPKGSTDRIKVQDYFTEKQLKEFWQDLRKRSKTSDKIALYFAEQMTGKAMQPVEGSFTGNITLEFDNTFKNASSDPT